MLSFRRLLSRTKILRWNFIHFHQTNYLQLPDKRLPHFFLFFIASNPRKTWMNEWIWDFLSWLLKECRLNVPPKKETNDDDDEELVEKCIIHWRPTISISSTQTKKTISLPFFYFWMMDIIKSNRNWGRERDGTLKFNYMRTKLRIKIFPRWWRILAVGSKV